MKIALVHDWFISTGGAEKVVHKIIEMYPDIHIYSLFDYLPKNERQWILNNKVVTPSYLQYLPFAKYYYRLLFPFYNHAIRQLDLHEYDLIISSSHVAAKNVPKTKDQIHISYCHTPARYVWDMRGDYIDTVKPGLLKKLMHFELDRFQAIDAKSSNQVTWFIANSSHISNRIQRNYNRQAKVIYPPVRAQYLSENYARNGTPGNYFLVISRLVFYKRIDLIVEAFNKLPHLTLKIIGKGPQAELLKRKAGPNIHFEGYQADSALPLYIHYARAMIFAGKEDFGITCVEAQACGIPVIALRDGGYRETVIEGETGMFFEHQSPDAIVQAIQNFTAQEQMFDQHKIMEHAQQFDEKHFCRKIRSFIDNIIYSKTGLLHCLLWSFCSFI